MAEGRGNQAAVDMLRQSQTSNATPVTTPPTVQETPTTGQAPPELDEKALATVADAAIKAAPEDLLDHATSAIPGILRQCALSSMKRASQVAYVLATTEHESKFGKPLYDRSESLVEDRNPSERNRKGQYSATVHTNDKRVTANSEADLDTKYWDAAYGDMLGNEKGTTDAANFRGRGYVQLTGRSNYEDMTKRLNKAGFTYTLDGVTYGGKGNSPLDLAANPTHVNRCPELAARVMVLGMTEGSFTGQKLDDHINDKETDYTNARSIVNGDTAKNGKSIATIARRYATALSGWASVFKVANQGTPTES